VSREALRAIVVDDESLARRGLVLRLQEMPDVEVIAECANGREALQAIAERDPDLVFLDIQMPQMDGFDVICELQPDAVPMIIFVTAFDHYAVEAFRVNAVDYILKPVDVERLQQAVARAADLRLLNEPSLRKARLLACRDDARGIDRAVEHVQYETPGKHWPERLVIKDGAEFSLVDVADIRWIDAAGDYMCIHTADRTHIMRTTMKQLVSRLDPDTFLRIHRSTIVNVNFISGARSHLNGEYLLTVAGGSCLKVSRGYSHKIRSLLNL
jgi:two-component system LytT family response regulator